MHLLKHAKTSPKVRAAIQSRDEAVTDLAERSGVTTRTVYKWCKRDTVEDLGHTSHRLQTTLTPAQETVVTALRKKLLVSLDDLLAVVREFLNPNASRSGLDRCLRRHSVDNLRDIKAKAPRPKHSAFKACEPGYMHIDVKYLPQVADESRRSYLRLAVWSSASTGGSRRCCKATIFGRARNWRRRCTAMSGSTTSTFRNQPWAARRPCRP